MAAVFLSNSEEIRLLEGTEPGGVGLLAQRRRAVSRQLEAEAIEGVSGLYDFWSRWS